MRVFKGLKPMILLLFAVAGQQSAHAAQEPYGPRIIRLFVVDRDTGKAKKVWLHDRRYFVAGEAGKRYVLRIQNVSKSRALAVLAVDGINVISGKAATMQDFEGYILKPKQVADIVGWRKDDAEVEAFEFSPQSQSFAAQSGRTAEIGLITMAVFRDYVPPRQKPVKPVSPPTPKPAKPSRHRDEAAGELRLPPPPPPPVDAPPLPAPPPPPPPAQTVAPPPPPPAKVASVAKAEPAASVEKLGTARGAVEAVPLPHEPFTKATQLPESWRVVEYDSEASLAAKGVLNRR